MILEAYDYKPNLHPYVLLGLYHCHSYLAIEIILSLAASPARLILGLRLEPQFNNEPYLATSLQDFWGRRWNLATVSILHSTVYEPVGCTSLVSTYNWVPLAMDCRFGPIASCIHNIPSIRPNARVTLLLPHSCESHMGGDVLLYRTRNVRGC